MKETCNGFPLRPMRIVLLSDTHGRHSEISVPEGDLLIHAGDFTSRGLLRQVMDFMTWFGQQPHRHKVLIAGNHDFLAERDPAQFLRTVPEGVTYLNDSGCDIEGWKVWGSPVQPWFHNWAFNRQRGADIQRHWDRIPLDTHILATHGPPYGILDQTARGESVGCEALTRTLTRLPALKLHVFGHIHESAGKDERNGVTYINASNLSLGYTYTNPPLVVDL